MSANNKPVQEFRLGAIKAVIWANPTDKGYTRHSVQICKIYKDADGNWQQTNSFGREDLPLVEKVANYATEYIYRDHN